MLSSILAPVGQRDGDLTCLFFSPAAMSIFLIVCLAVEPRASQYACEIHTQQSLYLEALGMLMGSMHDNCDCTCRWCKGGEGCKRWLGMCRSLLKFSDEFMCEKVDMLGEDKEDEFEHWGRRPACVAGECSNCGFRNPNGIPTDCFSVARHIEWWGGSVSKIKRWWTARRTRSSSYHRRSDRCVTFGTSSWSTPRR